MAEPPETEPGPRTPSPPPGGSQPPPSPPAGAEPPPSPPGGAEPPPSPAGGAEASPPEGAEPPPLPPPGGSETPLPPPGGSETPPWPPGGAGEAPWPAGGPGGPAFGALRAALEAALARSPGEAAPPALAPALAAPLPPPAKCRHLDGARLLRDNLRPRPGGPPGGAGGLRTALSILEKYGRNLLQPRPPRYWRAVKYNNPVFRGTVGAVRGGRAVLRLYGYTEETGDGLSFAPGVAAPHGPRVAAVTADVLLLRAELDLLLANKHPNPQFFTAILEGCPEEPPAPESPPAPEGAAPGAPPGAGGGCGLCGPPGEGPRAPCPACRVLPPPSSPPAPPRRPPWVCGACGGANGALAVLCGACERPRGCPGPPAAAADPPALPGEGGPPRGGGGPWACASCTFLNAAATVLCGVCERPRLAGRPPAPPRGWQCPHCTYRNEGPGRVCELCHRTAAAPPAPPADEEGPRRPGRPPAPPARSQEAERRRQERLREDGRRVVALVRAAEAAGLPPEAVVPLAVATTAPWGGTRRLEEPWGGPTAWAAAAVAGARAALPGALGALAEAAGRRAAADPRGPLGPISLREAARAWARARACPPRALEACLGARRRQVRALGALGGGERAAAAAALAPNGGDVWAALGDLQRRRLGPFQRRLWAPREPPLAFDGPDPQAAVRRALAALGLPSWGRAELLVALGRELGLPGGRGPALGDLAEAVRASPDRAFVRRLLSWECAVCGWALPRHQMQSLTACECTICPECFRQHFTIAVKEKPVGGLVCPACGAPDLADDAQRLTHFSTLDIQLRACLDAETYALFCQKLTERELLRDPKFLWCIRCSFGFIFEAEQGPAQCPQCHQRCCPRCQRPWEPEHGGLSCADFAAWKRRSDPQAQPHGLAAFLREHGIACPQCGVWYALARGGCMHFQCSQCRHHFCSGCYRPFYAKDSCPEGGCPLRGSLHGHHPRDCLFYLRDWDPPRLQRLLQENGVAFDTEPPPGASPAPGGGCGVLEQKETAAGLRDEPCGKEAPPGHAGLCLAHYKEYLVRVINERRLDPAPLYSLPELRAAAERHLPAPPPRRPAEPDAAYRRRLLQCLAEEAPLGPAAPLPRRPQ
ncbi:E3 ubiquitin-protein ligase RNF31 isoform X2 [Dromaius novaehollandiae]|uniref:E3 ubiquitin-protein ligase RNF31 isoform X2 n=1 Tax=Dromaius novaehollandiae TaxID=8790 RepID=UPI00311FC615